MAAQEGPVNCFYCNKRQNSNGRCTECATNNGLDQVLSYRWVRDVYLTINNKQYLVSFSNMNDEAQVSLALDHKPFLRIPRSANLTLENLKEKLNTYFMFL